MTETDKNGTSTPNKGYELVHFCEIDKYAAKSYCAIHGVDESLNLGDITQVDSKNINEFNMICGGSPCFTAGTLVLTDMGYWPIEKIICGDKVLTHNNRYMKVAKTMVNHTNSLIGFRTSVSETIYCTNEHPIYIRERHRVWDSQNRTNKRVFSDPIWKQAKDIRVGDYVGTAINQIEEIPEWYDFFYYKNQYKCSMDCVNELTEYFKKGDFWYIVGRFIGDGWLRKDDEKSVIICCEKSETKEITDRLDRLKIHYCVVKERTAYRIQIAKKELCSFLRRFGQGAANKHLTKDIINLPVDLLREFLNGYIESDGCYSQGWYKISSVSRRLIYEVGECVAKVYHRPFSIYYVKRPSHHFIEGRLVNQKSYYVICWKLDKNIQDKAFYEDGYIWSPVTKIDYKDTDEDVYNLEIEEDNTYMVQGVIVHNCQDFSVAGKQAGSTWKCTECGYEYNPLTVHYTKRDKCPECGSPNIDKSRSSLLVEWLRIIRTSKPKWGIYENVKNITGKKFKDTFQMFLDELHEYGYNTYYKVLNAKDYGIPQNRERVYLIIIQKEYDNGKFKFPEPFDNGLRLKDMLDDEVDEKYYVNTPRAEALIRDLVMSGKLEGGGQHDDWLVYP